MIRLQSIATALSPVVWIGNKAVVQLSKWPLAGTWSDWTTSSESLGSNFLQQSVVREGSFHDLQAKEQWGVKHVATTKSIYAFEFLVVQKEEFPAGKNHWSGRVGHDDEQILAEFRPTNVPWTSHDGVGYFLRLFSRFQAWVKAIDRSD